MASAKRLTDLGLAIAQGQPWRHKARKAGCSVPPLASITISPTPCPPLQAASSATPSGSLAKRRWPAASTQASSQDLETSTPQMLCITVTCLVCTIDESSDCSVVRDNGDDPWLHHG